MLSANITDMKITNSFLLLIIEPRLSQHKQSKIRPWSLIFESFRCIILDRNDLIIPIMKMYVHKWVSTGICVNKAEILPAITIENLFKIFNFF